MNNVECMELWLRCIVCSRGVLVLFFFFFKQKTAYEIRNCDWSSDVCSSDLSFKYSDAI